MASKLFNVRLDEKRRRKADRLRSSGRKLSDVVRDAIDTEYDAVARTDATRDPAAIVAAIIERFPDPDGLPPRTYDVHDARAARDAIKRRRR